jgi:hypothetical protein
MYMQRVLLTFIRLDYSWTLKDPRYDSILDLKLQEHYMEEAAKQRLKALNDEPHAN